MHMHTHRCERELLDENRRKIGMFAQLTSDKIISVHNVSEIYKVPLLLKSQNVAEIIANKLLMYLPKVCAYICVHVRMHLISTRSLFIYGSLHDTCIDATVLTRCAMCAGHAEYQ